jgi:hypothetical protein
MLVYAAAASMRLEGGLGRQKEKSLPSVFPSFTVAQVLPHDCPLD